MKKTITISLLTILISCISVPAYYNGEIDGNQFSNDYIKLRIPNNWKVRSTGGRLILIIQKQINWNGKYAFPTAIVEAGTINNNAFHTLFNNTWTLVKGSKDLYSKNELYSTNDGIDSIVINGIKFYSFETKLINRKFKIPDLLQTHYYFNVDTMYFHLSTSDYDRFDELKTDYKLLIESIRKK